MGRTDPTPASTGSLVTDVSTQAHDHDGEPCTTPLHEAAATGAGHLVAAMWPLVAQLWDCLPNSGNRHGVTTVTCMWMFP